MDVYLVIKTIHILSAAILFGTGIGIAFFMLRSRSIENLSEKHFSTHNTVVADVLFTLPAVIVQPLSGAWLVWQSGYLWSDLWIVLSMVMYVFLGLCWLPVVWIQIQLNSMVIMAQKNNTPLPERYEKLFSLWLMLGWPAFISLIAIFFLMVFKPA